MGVYATHKRIYMQPSFNFSAIIYSFLVLGQVDVKNKIYLNIY